jgi:ABC-type sugar transport system substrate-binding protein
MFKRIGLLSALALSLAGALPAEAQSGSIIYTTYYYSDASFATQVGQMHPHCYRGNITYTLTGSQSNYSQDEEVAICGPNGIEPLE